MAEHKTKPGKATPGATDSTRRSRRWSGQDCRGLLGALVPLTVAFLVLLLLPAGCKDDAAEQGSSEEPVGTSQSGDEESQKEESEPPPTAASEQNTSAEDAFLSEIAQITPILSRDESPEAILQAVQQHLEDNQARIDEVVTTLSDKRAAMTPDEREAFEDALSGREEVASFFDAMETFRSRATAEQMDALDALFARILPEE